jgi:hypothetical protein
LRRVFGRPLSGISKIKNGAIKFAGGDMAA